MSEVTSEKKRPCCCNYGSAVSGEWPEFECFRCPEHGGTIGRPTERCKRHTRKSDNQPSDLDHRDLAKFQSYMNDITEFIADVVEVSGNRPTEAELSAWRLGWQARENFHEDV